MAISQLLLGLCLLLAWILYTRLRWIRFEQHADKPRLPPSLIWGNMRDVRSAIDKTGSKRHVDYAFSYLRRLAGNPDMLTLDMRPITYVLCVVFSHQIAEQMTRTSKAFRYSVPKSPTLKELHDVIGETSIIRANGEQWKSLRRRFNPGFAHQHLITLLPQIMSKTTIFLSRLDQLARSSKEFLLDELCVTLTFDIIGAVVLDVDFNAQLPYLNEAPVVKNFRELLLSYDEESAFFKVNPLSFWLRKRRGRRADAAVRQVIRSKFAELQESRKINGGKQSSVKGRSILALSLADVDELSADIEQQTADQIRSFLFAGHDTTSILLQWAIYSLGLHPKALSTLCTELDTVLGPEKSPGQTARLLVACGEELLPKLSYLSAVIKETLRLYPPAGTARMVPPGSGWAVKMDDGNDIVVDGCVMYLCHYAIQRDPKVYGPDAEEFRPERWLGNADTYTEATDESNTTEKGEGFPAAAWRPFERGPRNCIGQELANLEARVILACVVRGYTFEKVGLGRLVDGKVAEGEKLVNVSLSPGFQFDSQVVLRPGSSIAMSSKANGIIQKRQITSKPIDRMPMKVRFSKREA